MADLIKRMKAGDRVAAATFMAESAPRIRRRFRGKLGRDVRRLFDSQDLVSTISRRLDVIIMKHALAATSTGELWSLIGSLATHSIAEYTDKALKHRDFVAPPEVVAQPEPAMVEVKPAQIQSGVGEARPQERGVIDQCMERLENNVDRTILALRVSGHTHLEIAGELDVTSAAVRKRWQRIRAVLRSVTL